MELYRHWFQSKIEIDDTSKPKEREGLALQPPFFLCDITAVRKCELT